MTEYRYLLELKENGGNSMPSNKLLAALSYFSVFFAPLLVPVIIYFVTDDREVKSHAKRSFVSHIIPVALLIAGMIILSFSLLSVNNYTNGVPTGFSFWQLTPLLFMLLYGLLFMGVIVWNVYNGVKVLR